MFWTKKNFDVYGEQGGISTCITLPKGFDTVSDRCPMVILMHGFMANKKFHPIPTLAKALPRQELHQSVLISMLMARVRESSLI